MAEILKDLFAEATNLKVTIMITILAAVDKNNAIGYNNKLLTSDPMDMYLFSLQTKGSVVVMGRKTQESLPKGYLPGRTNIVVSSKPVDNPNIITTCHFDIPSIIRSGIDTYIIGGESIYKQALEQDIVDQMIITHHSYCAPNADTYFPEIDPNKWQPVRSVPYVATANTHHLFTSHIFTHIVTYKRK